MGNKKIAIYEGVECEGPDAGTKTIFIPRGAVGFLSVDKVFNAIKSKDITNFYFGAKERRGVDTNDLFLINRIMAFFSSYKIYIEVDSMQQIKDIPVAYRSLPEIKFIYTIKPEEEELYSLQAIKLETKEVLVWYDIKYSLPTLLNNPAYENDKIILE